MRTYVLIPRNPNWTEKYFCNTKEICSFLHCEYADVNRALLNGTELKGWFIDYSLLDDSLATDKMILRQTENAKKRNGDKTNTKLIKKLKELEYAALLKSDKLNKSQKNILAHLIKNKSIKGYEALRLGEKDLSKCIAELRTFGIEIRTKKEKAYDQFVCERYYIL